MISMKFNTLCIFRKSVENIQVALKSDKYNSCFASDLIRPTAEMTAASNLRSQRA
jgi:hypothetical protein